MQFRRSNDHHEIDFDLTAMIDVVFLLIIFFTFSTVFAKTVAKQLDLPLETGEAASAVSPASTITVDIAKDGTMSLPGSGSVTAEQLLNSIKGIFARAAAKGGTPDFELILRADRATPARFINSLAAILARNGVKSWKLATAGEGGSSAISPAGAGAGGGGQ